MATQPLEPQQPTRSFTYEGIAAYIATIITSLETERQRYALRSISLISAPAQPIWIVKMDSIWEGTFTHTFITYVVEQRDSRDQSRLNVTWEREVPPGSSTVADEDATMARLEAERLEALQRRYEAPQKSGEQASNDTAE